MDLPVGTVFSYYTPCYFRDLLIKGSAPNEWHNDFLVTNLIGAVENNSSDEFVDSCEKMEKGERFDTDFESYGREGLFDDNQLFAIYEKEDVIKLVRTLQETYESK